MVPKIFTPANISAQCEEELSLKIDLFMYKIHMPHHLKGREYLAEAIEIVYKNPRAVQNVVAGLYNNVAKKNGTTTSCVERNIRTAINYVWQHGNTEILDECLECPGHTPEAKPSPREFIAIISNKLRRNLLRFDISDDI